MGILDDSFKINSYLNKHGKVTEGCIFTQERLDNDVDSLWMEYCQLSKSERARQDQLCFEQYGFSCQGLYESIKENSNALITESDADLIPSYAEDSVEQSITWSEETNIPIIMPTKTLELLEELWQTWDSFPTSAKHQSDEASIQFYGIANQPHYKYLKSEFLQSGSINLVEGSIVIEDSLKSHEKFICSEGNSLNTRVKDLLSLISKKNESYDDAIISTTVDKAIDQHQSTTQHIQYDVIPFEDLPFYTPEELIDDGLFQDITDTDNGIITSIISEEEMKHWLEQYTLCYHGFSEGYDPVKWKNTLQRLFLKRSIAENTAPYDRAIQNLGWPPTALFNPENQVKASKRIKMMIKEVQGSTQMIDLSGFQSDSEIEISESEDIKTDLKPVFLVLQSGKSLFSNVIKAVTKSKFSHIAISFDPKLEEMISFGIEESKKGVIGGLIKENIKNKSDIKIGVFTIFLREKDWKKLKKNVDTMVKNMNKTVYSYFNIIVSQLFRIPVEFDTAMVCSQFVDKMLKLTDIDITKMNSSLVSPASIEAVARENKRIYKLFEGSCKRYNPNRILQTINTLLKKCKPIKESILWVDPVGIVFGMADHIQSIVSLQELDTKLDLEAIDPRVKRIYETMIKPCLEAECYTEAKEAPIQIDKYGNIFINNMKKRNYEADYKKTHRLLKEYEKSGNIEGMKYELSRLWAMQLYVEEKIHSKKFTDMDLDERNKTPEMKVYPKLVNDMQYFLGVIMKEDPNFNFSKYYEKTQFNSDNIKIGHDTVIWAGKYLRAMLSGI